MFGVRVSFYIIKYECILTIVVEHLKVEYYRDSLILFVYVRRVSYPRGCLAALPIPPAGAYE